MGMYSFFTDEDIRVKDWDGLKAFLKMFEKEYPDWASCMGYDKMIKTNSEGKEYFTFEEWNDIKLISYWYDAELIFLTCVAKYLEDDCNVDWEFENKDEAGYVNFSEGKCNITTGVMNWEEWASNSNFHDTTTIPASLKKLLIVEGLK